MAFSEIWVVCWHRGLIIWRETSHDHKTSRQPTFLAVNTLSTVWSNIKLSWLTHRGLVTLVVSCHELLGLEYPLGHVFQQKWMTNPTSIWEIQNSDSQLRILIPCLHLFTWHLTLFHRNLKKKKEKNQVMVDMLWEITFTVTRLDEILKCHLHFHWVLHY